MRTVIVNVIFFTFNKKNSHLFKPAVFKKEIMESKLIFSKDDKPNNKKNVHININFFIVSELLYIRVL